MPFHKYHTINSNPQGSRIVLFIFFGLHRQISSSNARSRLMSRDLSLKREISQLKTRILLQDLDVLYLGISSYILPYMTVMGHHNTKSKSQSIVILCLSQLCRSGFDPICWKLLNEVTNNFSIFHNNRRKWTTMPLWWSFIAEFDCSTHKFLFFFLCRFLRWHWAVQFFCMRMFMSE